MAITLFLVRTPNKPFSFNGMPGRWGELIAIKGPTVTAASLVQTGGAVPLLDNTNRCLELSTNGGGGAITEVRRYTTMERTGGYVQLRPNCGTFKVMKHGAYQVTFEPRNWVVQHLYQSKDRLGKWIPPVVHDGNCFRIHGAMSAPERGILIHEAPHVGWLIGCISPRPLNTFETLLSPNKPKSNGSYQAMTELFQFVGNERANFFVLDW